MGELARQRAGLDTGQITGVCYPNMVLNKIVTGVWQLLWSGVTGFINAIAGTSSNKLSGKKYNPLSEKICLQFKFTRTRKS